MIGFRTVVKGASLCVLLIGLVIVTTFAGCERQAGRTFASCKRETQKAADYDYIGRALREIVEEVDYPLDMRERAKEALAKWESGALFPEPILINVVLECLGKDGFLDVIAVNKGPDLVGVRITEEHIGPDDTTRTLQEDYPAYVVFSPPAPLPFQGFPVFIRDRDQRKDERAWQEFLIWDQDQREGERVRPWQERLIREIDGSERGYEGRTAPETALELPFIWISLPQPKKVRVFVSVYDSAGHVSKALEVKTLIHALPKGPRPPTTGPERQ